MAQPLRLHLKTPGRVSIPSNLIRNFAMASWLSDAIDDPTLRNSVEELIQSYPNSSSVIRQLIDYFQNKIASSSDEDEREHKKRRVSLPATKSSLTVVACIPDISFQLPARKRFDLVITPTHLALTNTKTEDVEYQFVLNDFQLGACVPTPGPSKASTFVLFLNTPDTDPVVFNVPHKGDLIIQRSTHHEKASDNDKHQHIIRLLSVEARIKMTTPQKDTYSSSGVSSNGQRANEDYISAYLKAKEGNLYFLPEGILYGFKKPTVFFPLSCIASTVFCSITQRTFDIALTVRRGHQPLGSSLGLGKTDDDTRIDFSMIEQSEYAAIDDYIKKARISDRSLDEEFKAPETKAAKEAKEQKTSNAQELADEDEEEQDQDFEPSESEEDPLEYDSEAKSSDEEGSEQIEDTDDEDQEGIQSQRGRHVAEADEENIEHTDNEEDDIEAEQDAEGDHIMSEGDAQDEEEEDEVEEVLEDEEEEEEDDRSETIGSTSEDEDKEHGYHSHSRRHEMEEAEDELEESD